MGRFLELVDFKRHFRASWRNPADLVLATAAALGLLLTAYLVRRDIIIAWEYAVFRHINELPDALFPLIWPFMQYGVFITIPVVAAVAVYFRQYRLALLLLAGGIGIYFLALVVKDVVERFRPVDLLAALQAREQVRSGSLGFPSGHAAVAATIATFAHRYLPRGLKALSVFTLAVVLFGRIYVGAHLPLDVIGGLFLGILVASAINYAIGLPHRFSVRRSA